VPEEARYRFGPLERRGLVAGWRGGQIASVAGGLFLAVVVLHADPTALGAAGAFLAVLVAVAFACWPVAGRTGEEWGPTLLRWLSDGVSRRRRTLSPAPRRGSPDGGAPGHGPLAGVSLLSVRPPVAAGDGSGAASPAGVFYDRSARSYTAVVAVRGRSFTLLGPDEKERRINGWAGVLAAQAREHSVVHRLQWVASTTPDDGRGVRTHLAERAVLGAGDPAFDSYRGVLTVAGSSASRHEVLVALQVVVDRRTQRAVRSAGGGRSGATAVLLRELGALARQLADADMTVVGVLGPDQLAAVVRRSGQAAPPGDRPRPRRRSASPVTSPWPMAMEAQWGLLRTDETWHATYWVSEWPRVDVGPEFMGPLLLAPGRRSVAMVMEPLSPTRAVRQVEQARTADLADSELRRRGGFLATARRTREAELVARREVELADGHGSFRFSGYVTVTATSAEALEDACQVTEQVAGQANLELRRLFGDQARGFTCTLPLCRGLS
jgi:hypothetical protein